MEKVREKIIARICAGDSINSIANIFGVNRSTVWRAKKRYEETGPRVPVLYNMRVATPLQSCP